MKKRPIHFNLPMMHALIDIRDGGLTMTTGAT
jgi:hypothetical protein